MTKIRTTAHALDPGPGIETFDHEQCLEHLRQGGVGRLALRGRDAPELRPVNFALRDDQLIIRTGDGSILAAARAGEAAGFEIDEIDRLEHTGWSVVATGKLSELESDAANLALPLRPWASGRKDFFVAVSLDRVTGLRIPPGRGNQ
jgi:nitroimidazol reductase NimA-like FMN-containing flavoprotein (pyridoxamine 5'-phosphate oxidase superfamily)